MRKVPVQKWAPVALFVGILAAVYVIIARETGLILWAAFISWPLYFLAGSTIKKMDESIIGLSGGLLAGWALIKLLPYFAFLGAFWTLPAVVVVVAFIIVFLELVPEVDMAPAYFFSFASFFAIIGATDPATGQAYGAGFDTVIKLWIPLMVGLAFAFVNSIVVNKVDVANK